jgi:DNA-binding NarL/FixJ family response regulator
VPASLTKSEQRVVDLVARGWTNDEVAHELSLRTKTVEWREEVMRNGDRLKRHR